ncbi:MAG: hypothetical protein LBF64_02685 [Oscillospiraceae bacterium]|jgi:nitroreductase|nr:hypothetical protein [Oscillospiraceae bacterium]
MLHPDLYPHIFTRKSIRKYTGTPLSAAQIDAVRGALGGLVPLFAEERYKLVCEPENGGVLHRVYAYGEDTAGGNANIGFLLQQLDLALHGQGLGRLWFGMGKAPKDIACEPPLSYAICLKVGNAAGPLARAGAAEFDRKPIEEVVADAGLQHAFEAVRLAPSAANSQPWRFVRAGEFIHAYRKRLGLVKAALFGRMNQVDMGIALCHAVLGLAHEGVAVKGISADAPSPAPAPDGYVYTAAIQI